MHHIGYDFTGLSDLSISLALRGHEVSDIYWSGSRNYAAIKKHQNLTCYLVPGLSFSLDGLITEYPYLPALPKIIQMINPDIVHCQSHLFLPTLQSIRTAKKLGYPCVVTVHGVFVDRNAVLNFGQRVFLRTLGLEIFKAADRIICLTRSDAERVIALGCSSEKIRVIPNAVDVQQFHPIEARTEELVIWTGRFVPEKGLEYLIEAARIVAEKNDRVQFFLIGYGPLKTKLMKLALDYGLLGKNIKFGGPYSRDEMPKVLGKASIFVLSSLSEGLSISVLEAMACGLPIVCTDILGVKEVIEDGVTGVVVPPRNPVAISQAILTLLDADDLRKRLGHNARKMAMERYNWDLVIDQLEAVYSEVYKTHGFITLH